VTGQRSPGLGDGARSTGRPTNPAPTGEPGRAATSPFLAGAATILAGAATILTGAATILAGAATILVADLASP
jgi:hypothetical protein